MRTTWSRRGAVLVLLAVAAWAFSYRLGAVPLLDDPNEAEYAEVAREMLESGDWMSPHLNYVLFLNKPPLAYWMIGLSNLAFGVNEFAARLPSACAAMAILVLLVALGMSLYEADTGLLAGLVLLATGGFLVETHQVRADLWLALGVSGSIAAFARLLLFSSGRGEVPETPQLRLPMRRMNSRATENAKSPCGDSPPPKNSLRGWGWEPAQAGLASFVARGFNRRMAATADGTATPWPLIGWQVSLAVGVLAKGLLGVLLPGLICAVVIICERRFDLIPKLLHPRAWWIFALLIVPWHAVMSLEHVGFVWDYVVHQHLLFFFDRKVPRDSVPVSLLTFWAAFALRLFPWTVFAPLAVLAATRRARGGTPVGDRLVLTWAAVPLLFFSFAPSRMEHYTIPALPALALLTARLFRDYSRQRSSALSRAITAHVIVLAAVAVTGPFIVPRIIAAQEWLAPVHELVDLARRVSVLVALGLMLAAASALRKKQSWVPVMIASTLIAALPLVVDGLVLIARVNSSAGMAAALRLLVEPGERVIYEAPVEYQNCAGFDFYMRRRLDLLRPPQFVAPAYLEPYVGELFITPERLAGLWEDERAFFVTDPLLPRAHLDGTVPHPFYVVARDTARWVVTNRRVH